MGADACLFLGGAVYLQGCSDAQVVLDSDSAGALMRAFWDAGALN